MNKFVPLHIISGYSFLQSGLTIARISDAIKKNEYYGAGLADNSAMYGIPEFVQAMDKINKPFIIGMNLVIQNEYVTLFVISETGYRNLLKLNSFMQNEELTFENIKEFKEGIICVLETNKGTFNEKFIECGDTNTFRKYLFNISDVFKDNFYLGIEIISSEDKQYAEQVRKFADEYAYECVAFPSIKYAKKDDAIVLDILDAIANKEVITQKSKEGFEYFMTEAQYQKIYSEKEIENTFNILQKSSFSFHQKRGEILHVCKDNPDLTLKSMCFSALEEKGLEKNDKYVEQLNHELNVISSMKFSDYFLLVNDYVSWAKNNDVLVGPGRGSAAGSLVSYLLNITEVDPIEFDLQFERFLNSNRKTMPDIDVDFMDTRRNDVVQYMRDKYGANKVATIMTFQTMLAKKALDDIGDVYGYEKRHIKVLKKILSDSRKDYDLRSAYTNIPEFKALIDSDKFFLEIVSLASKIEGLPRQSSIHAAGIVVNNNPLDESIPVTIDYQGNYISQYESGYLEEQGFLKMDFLSLSNLTTIYNCVNLVNKYHPEAHVDKFNVPYDEKEVYDLIASGKTMGIFQLESSMMKKAINILKPDSLMEVAKLQALGRPGPMEFIGDYADRRDGKQKFRYASEELKEVLSSTYGIIVFQEQINKIAQVMAGFSMADADLFRRAVSKKDEKTLANSKDSFVKGSIANGYEEKVANAIFDRIIKFANYGFNKSHSIVYSIISCRLAWLKVHYPLEFYKCILDYGSSTDGVTINDYIAEMKSRNYKIVNPSVNHPNKEFDIEENALRYPLSRVFKDEGSNTIDYIIKERENGIFIDFYDFILRMNKYGINEKSYLKLINSGALDELCSSRETMRASLDSAIQYATLLTNEDGTINETFKDSIEKQIEEREDNPLDNLEKEYEILKCMLSSNPLSHMQDILNKKNVTPIVSAKQNINGETVVLAGIIRAAKVINTKKGSKMAFVKVYDETDEIEATVFPRLYERVSEILNRNTIVLLTGHCEEREEEIVFALDKLERLEY